MADTDFPELATPRLVLREIVMADAPALLQIHGDRATMKWFGRDPITTIEEARALVQNFDALRTLPNPGVRWGIELLEFADPQDPLPLAIGGRLVGSCGFFRWNRGWRSCSVGYELARDVQGRGLMREALQAAFTWGFELMDLERIEAQVHPDNLRSIASLKGLGFVDEGLAREAGHWLGRRHDMMQLGLLKREFVAPA